MTSILLIEDDPMISSLLVDFLKEKNYSIAHVDDGPAALESINSQKFDLILMDENLPTMNGSEILVKIKANPNLAQIPVIVITSKKDEDFQADMLNEGADDFIQKPFRINILMARITNVLKRSSPSRTINIEIDPTADPASLTERECQVLQGIVKGHNNQTIAQELHLTEGTVANYIKSIFAKLKTSNRTQTAIIAIKLNLI
jgi:DNA-binding NarL/FixJ family response regulator